MIVYRADQPIQVIHPPVAAGGDACGRRCVLCARPFLAGDAVGLLSLEPRCATSPRQSIRAAIHPRCGRVLEEEGPQ